MHLGIHFSVHPASSLFGNQQQLTHTPVKSSNPPLRKMPVSQGVAPRHTFFTSSCVIPLWDSVTAHSPSGKELKLSSLENHVFQGLFVNILTLSCLGSLWFATHPNYSIKSICQFILSVVYFYSGRPPICREI